MIHRLPRIVPTLSAISLAASIRPLSSSAIINMGITDWADKKDGAFKRQISSFRDHIEEGGNFAPEKGEDTNEVHCG